MFRKLFAYLYDRGMKKKEKTLLGSKRAELLGGISGNILEIGSGTGINFQYYTNQAKVTAIEPSVYMSEHRVGEKDIHILPYTIAEYIQTIEQGSPGFDYIVCTLVLCSIPEYEKEIKNLQLLLNPGGTIIVMEHILSDNTYIAYIQKLCAPLQKCLADGCHLDRQTDVVFKDSDMECLYEEYFGGGNVFYIGKYVKH